MANKFNLIAELSLAGPNNIRSVVSKLQRELGGVTTNIKVKIDASNAKSVISNLQTQLAGVTSKVNLKISPNAERSIVTISRKFEGLNKNIVASIGNVNNLNSALAALTSAVAGFTRVHTTHNAALSNTAKNIRDVQKNTQLATSELQEFGRVAGLSLRRFAGYSIAAGSIFGLVTAFHAGFAEAVIFDKEMTRLSQVTKISTRGLQEIEGEVTRLSTSLGVSSKELILTSTTLAQAELSARDTKIALQALAKSSLAPSFKDMNQTTEASIAVFKQFELQAKDLESVLGSINAVSAAFAVEAGDITTAIKLAGSTFANSSKGVAEGEKALQQFIATFTAVRSTTRLSAEQIANGLNTVFARIQRPETIEFLREFGIELKDMQGKFIGPFAALDELSKKLSQFDPRDIKLRAIIEEIGGIRQLKNVIPILTQFQTAREALVVAERGRTSLTRDAIVAQQSLAVQFAKTRESFLALIRDITETGSFKALIDLSLGLANGLIKVADASKPLIPFLTLIASIKSVNILREFGRGFVVGLRGGGGPGSIGANLASAATGKNKDKGTSGSTLALNNNTVALKNLTATLRNLNTGGLRKVGRNDLAPSSELPPGGLKILDSAGKVIPLNLGQKPQPEKLTSQQVQVRGAFAKRFPNVIPFFNDLKLNNKEMITAMAAYTRVMNQAAKGTLTLDAENKALSAATTKATIVRLNATQKERDNAKRAQVAADRAKTVRAIRAREAEFNDAADIANERTAARRGNGLEILNPNFVPNTGRVRRNRLRGLGGKVGSAAIGASFAVPVAQSILGVESGPGADAFAGAAIGGGTAAFLGAGPIGIATVAALSALSEFTDGLRDQDIKEALDALATSTNEVNIAMQSLTRNGSFQAVESAFASSRRANNLNINNRFAIDRATRLDPFATEGAGRGLLNQTRGGGTAGFISATRSLGSASVQSLFGFEGANRNIEREIQAKQEVNAQELISANSDKIQIASQNIKNQLSAGAKLFTKDVDSGLVHLTDLGKKLEEQIGFLAFTGPNAQLNAEAVIRSNDPRRAIGLGAQTGFALQEQITAQIQLDEAMRSMNKEADLTLQKFIAMGDAIKRVSTETEAFNINAERLVSSLSGDARIGRLNPRLTNVVENPGGFSVKQFDSALSEIENIVGGNQVRALTGQVRAGKLVDQLLPKIFEDAIRETNAGISAGLSGEELGDTVLARIEKGIAALPSDIVSEENKRTLRSNLTSAIQEKEFQGSETKFAATQDSFKQLLGPIQDRADKAVLELAKTLDAGRGSFAAQMDNLTSMILQKNKLLARATDIRIESEIDVAQILGKSLTPEELSRGTTTRVKGLTGGLTNPSDILGRFNDLQKQSEAVNKQLQGTSDVNETIRLSDNLKDINVQLKETHEALEVLANDTKKASAIREKLNELEQRGQAGRNLLETLLTGGAQDIAKLGRNLQAFNQFRATGNLPERAQDRRGVLDVIRQIQGLLPPDKAKQLEQDFFKAGARGLNFPAGLGAFKNALDPALNGVEGKEGQNLVDQLKLANDNQAKAAEALARIANNDYGKLITEQLKELVARLKDGVEGTATQYQAKGGSIFKPRGSDTVPAMLTPGEFVVNAKATRRNRRLLEQINGGAMYAAGGGFAPSYDDLSGIPKNVKYIKQGGQFRKFIYKDGKWIREDKISKSMYKASGGVINPEDYEDGFSSFARVVRRFKKDMKREFFTPKDPLQIIDAKTEKTIQGIKDNNRYYEDRDNIVDKTKLGFETIGSGIKEATSGLGERNFDKFKSNLKGKFFGGLRAIGTSLTEPIENDDVTLPPSYGFRNPFATPDVAEINRKKAARLASRNAENAKIVARKEREVKSAEYQAETGNLNEIARRAAAIDRGLDVPLRGTDTGQTLADIRAAEYRRTIEQAKAAEARRAAAIKKEQEENGGIFNVNDTPPGLPTKPAPRVQDAIPVKVGRPPDESINTRGKFTSPRHYVYPDPNAPAAPVAPVAPKPKAAPAPLTAEELHARGQLTDDEFKAREKKIKERYAIKQKVIANAKLRKFARTGVAPSDTVSTPQDIAAARRKARKSRLGESTSAPVFRTRSKSEFKGNRGDRARAIQNDVSFDLDKGTVSIPNYGTISIEEYERKKGKGVSRQTAAVRREQERINTTGEQSQYVSTEGKILGGYNQQTGTIIVPGFGRMSVEEYEKRKGKRPAKYSASGGLVPAYLHDGEYVVRRDAARKHKDMLEAINSDKIQRFQDGGNVGNYGGSGGGKGWQVAMDNRSLTALESFSTASTAFGSAISQFGAYVKQLEAIKIPETITFQGKLDPVQVVMSGDNPFANAIIDRLSAALDAKISNATRGFVRGNTLTGEVTEGDV